MDDAVLTVFMLEPVVNNGVSGEDCKEAGNLSLNFYCGFLRLLFPSQMLVCFGTVQVKVQTHSECNAILRAGHEVS